MIFRNLAAIAVAGLGLAAFGATSQGAVSVLGTGPSQSCFQFAEYGGNPRDGIEACTDSLQGESLTTRDRAATLINRGILISRNNDPDGALNDYNAGLRIDPTLGEGYVDRGATEIVLKNYDIALADFDKGLSLNANKPEIAYYDRAIANEALGNIKEAYNDYKKAVELRPDFALANEQLMRFKVVRKTHTDGA